MGDFEIRRIGNKRLLGPLMNRMPVPVNSDFEPYVDLNAPRMRFLGRDALELVRLGLLPVPLAEIFGQPLTQAPSDSQISAHYFTRHAMSQQAQALLRAVEAQDPTLAPADMRDYVAALRTPATDCANDQGRESWLNAVHGLASRTTPFLTVSARSTLWTTVRAQGCATALLPAELAWLELLEASGHGAAAGIAAAGEKLFTAPLPKMSGSQIMEALIATVTAKAAIGQNAEAQALLRAYVPMLQDPGDYGLALRLAINQAGAAGN